MGFSRWEYELAEPAQGQHFSPPESALHRYAADGGRRSIRVNLAPLNIAGFILRTGLRVAENADVYRLGGDVPLQLFQIKMVSMADAVAFVSMHTDALYRVHEVAERQKNDRWGRCCYVASLQGA